MTEMEVAEITKLFDARYKPMIREVTAYAVAHEAMISALMETHPNPQAALAAAQAHLEAYAVLVLYSTMEETQVQRILAAGQETLAKSAVAIERALGTEAFRAFR